jgi:hypothetical protein
MHKPKESSLRMFWKEAMAGKLRLAHFQPSFFIPEEGLALLNVAKIANIWLKLFIAWGRTSIRDDADVALRLSDYQTNGGSDSRSGEPNDRSACRRLLVRSRPDLFLPLNTAL